MLRILLAGDYPNDARLGSTKVLLKLQQEFRDLGHACDLLLADGFTGAPRNPYLRQALGPIAALRAVQQRIAMQGPYDVIDIASAEGLWIGALRPGAVRGAAIVSRSNGLEHLNYQRMLDDHTAGLLHKPWTRRLFHPLVRLTQVAAAARHADRLLLLNEADRAFALAHGWKRDDAIDIVPHGVSSNFLRTQPPVDAPRGAGLLFCGSWTGVKGVTYLAEAFTRLVRGGTPVNLTILGGGIPEADIRRDFPADVQSWLTVRERAAEDVVMQAYRSHDALVWPSTYEGFGMVLLEAMSQRLPVIATPVGCARSLIRSGRTGLIVAPRDAVSLADAMQEMLASPELRARCADEGAQAVQAMSWTATAQRTLTVYDRAMVGHRAH